MSVVCRVEPCVACCALGDEGVDATWICSCKQLHMCDAHTVVHRRRYPDHQVFPVKAALELTCAVHAGDDGCALTLYCNSPACKKLICAVCLLRDHKEHRDDVITVAEAKSLNMDEMRRNAAVIERGIADVGASQQQVGAAMQGLDANLEATITAIEAHRATEIAKVRCLWSCTVVLLW